MQCISSQPRKRQNILLYSVLVLSGGSVREDWQNVFLHCIPGLWDHKSWGLALVLDSACMVSGDPVEESLEIIIRVIWIIRLKLQGQLSSS